MQKSRRNKDNFRYERVDLARADSSDSEDDLDRVLGPSTTKGKKKETKRGAKCGCCFAVCGLLMALATLGIVIVYGTVWVPNGLREQLIANHLYPFETNGTTNGTDEITDITTENTTEIYEVTSILSSTIAPEIDPEDSEDKTSVEGPDEMTNADEDQEPDDNDRYLKFDENSNMLEYPDEVINNVQDEYVRQQRNDAEESLLDPGNIYPEHDLNTEFEDNLGFFDTPNYLTDDDLTNEDLEYIQELLQKHPKNLKRNEFLDIDKKSVLTETEEPETVVEEVTQESVVEVETTPKLVENEEEINEIPKLTTEENSTENIIQDKDEDDEWVWPQNLYNDYKDDKAVLAVSVTLTICLVLSFIFMCLICRRKSRERAKKRHFARLVSDLNATEKFTLVTPSDEEDNSE